MDNQRSRFKGAPWFPTEKVMAIVGGAGGIGSWLSFYLARAGFTPYVYDFDMIEEHNLGGQLFAKSYIGELKTVSLQKIIKDFCDMDIMIDNSKFDTDSMGHQYMFSAFDNMQARKDMFEVWYEANKDNKDAIFIDGRLLMEHLQIFCVTPDTAMKYKEEYLFDDSEVEDEECTLKQTSHTAGMIATYMVGFFTNHITNVVQGSKVRQVPFFYEYFVPINMVTDD